MLRIPRMTFAAFGILAASSAFDAAQADPYRWCADYTVLGGIGARTDFVTLRSAVPQSPASGACASRICSTTGSARRVRGQHDASNRERDWHDCRR